MKRSPEVQEFIDNFSKKLFGKSQSECQDEKICPFCRKKIGEFKDELSKKEYLISEICQECQDSIFG